MADKPDKKPEAAPDKKDAHDKGDGHAKPAKAGLLGKMPILLGAVMVLEAVVLFAGFKFLGGGPKAVVAVELAPEKTEGHGGGHDDGHGGHDASKGAKPIEKGKQVEMSVVEFKAPNTLNGRRYIYDVSIWIGVKSENEAKVRESIKERENSIKDRVRTIIAQMDPEKLGGGSEPELNTLRRQIKVQLENIIGDDMIAEVLVPRCTPYRADF